MVELNQPWVIVSNRLPFAFDAETGKPSAATGGLVTALRGVHIEHSAQWVGTVPDTVHPETWSSIEQFLHERESHFRFTPVFITSDIYDAYYNGICNDVLWPLFHYETQYVNFNALAWEAYRQVNQQFAQTLAEQAPSGALIWIHDFHFFLLPGYLRTLRNDVRIGFFLHIPFPQI